MSFHLRSRSNIKQDENCESNINFEKSNKISLSQSMVTSDEIDKSQRKKRIYFTTFDLKEGDKVYAKAPDRTYKEATIIGKFSNSYMVKFKNGIEKIIEGTKMKRIEEKTTKKIPRKSTKIESLNSTVDHSSNLDDTLNENTTPASVPTYFHNTRSSNRRVSIISRLESRGFSKDLFKEPIKRKRKSRSILSKAQTNYISENNHEPLSSSVLLETAAIDVPLNTSVTNNIYEDKVSFDVPLLDAPLSSSEPMYPPIEMNPIIENDNQNIDKHESSNTFDVKACQHPTIQVTMGYTSIDDNTIDNNHALIHDYSISQFDPAFTKYNTHSKLNGIDTTVEDEYKVIDCACGKTDSSNHFLTIQCTVCKHWQHTLCIDILPSHLSTYTCYKCSRRAESNPQQFDEKYFIKNGMFSDPILNNLCNVTTDQSIIIRNINNSISKAYEAIIQYKSNTLSEDKYHSIFKNLTFNLKELEIMANNNFTIPTLEAINQIANNTEIKHMLMMLESINN